MRYLHKIAVIVAVIIGVLFGGRADASPSYVAAPPAYLYDATAYTNIVETGDFFALLQYQLAVSDWCSYLTVTTGCSDSQPTEPTSFPSGYVWLNLYSGSGSTLEQQAVPARIDYALGGIYVSPGSTLSWPPTDWVVCIEPEATAFDAGTAVGACLTPRYNAALTTAAAEQRAQMGQDAVQMVRDIEQGRDLPLNSFVVSGASGQGKLTSDGRKIALEALSVMDIVAPEIFQAASFLAIPTAYVTPLASGPLQTTIDAQAGSLPSIGANLGGLIGLAGPTWWTLGWIILGLAFGFGINKIASGGTGVGDPFWLIAGVLGGAMIGLWTGGPRLAAVVLTVFVLGVVAMMGIVRSRLPSTTG